MAVHLSRVRSLCADEFVNKQLLSSDVQEHSSAFVFYYLSRKITDSCVSQCLWPKFASIETVYSDLLCDCSLQVPLLQLRQMSPPTSTLAWYCLCLLMALLKALSLGHLLISFQGEGELLACRVCSTDARPDAALLGILFDWSLGTWSDLRNINFHIC